MNWGIDLSQSSTQRGLVWVVTCLMVFALILMGKTDAAVQALSTGAGVAGALGMLTKD